MKEVLKSIPFTAIIITYLFICGGMYQLGFWSTFNLDPFSLIGIWDIPKNFIYPFMISGGIAILATYIYSILANAGTKGVKLTETKIWVKFLLLFAFVAVLVLFRFRSESLSKNEYFWIITCTVIGGSIIIELTILPLLVSLIPNFIIRLNVVILLIYCPVFTFISGKIISLEIYHNKSAKRIAIKTKEINNNSTDTLALKFLGFLGDKFIISSLDNKRVFVLNQSAYDMIELSDSPNVVKPKEIIKKGAVNDIIIDTTIITKGDTTK